MDSLVNSIKREINKYASQEEVIHREPCTIHKVPQHIREVDRSSYEPIVLSVGPYHQGAPALLHMEKEKWKCLDFLLKLDCKKTLHDYLKLAAGLEKRARDCYSDDVKMERKQFLRMLLLDVCFILVKIDGSVGYAMPGVNRHEWTAVQDGSGATKVKETGASSKPVEEAGSRNITAKFAHQHDSSVIEIELCNNGASCTPVGRNETENDKTVPCNFNNVGDWYSILAWHDLFLLENQIPFFVVDRIYRFVMDDNMMGTSPAEKLSECVEDILRQFPTAIEEANRPKQFHHFLHLCHIYLRPSQKTEEIQASQIKPGYLYRLLHFGHNYTGIAHRPEATHQFKIQMQQKDCFQAGQLPSRWRQAVQYHDAGIGLVKREYNKHEKHSLLDIKFSNGIVEVPCFLIDENTESLFKNLIAFEQVDPRFGNDITAYIVFMSQLVSTPEDAVLLAQKRIIVHMLDSDDDIPSLFTRLTKQVSFGSHYQSRLNRWLAWLWRNHFSNPWLALAVLAAVIMLVCAVVQTIFTILAYIKPP
jgi:hypothetical protein